MLFNPAKTEMKIALLNKMTAENPGNKELAEEADSQAVDQGGVDDANDPEGDEEELPEEDTVVEDIE